MKNAKPMIHFIGFFLCSEFRTAEECDDLYMRLI